MTNLELTGMVAIRDYERQRAKHMREAGWFAALAATQASRPVTSRSSRFSLPHLAAWILRARPVQTASPASGNA